MAERGELAWPVSNSAPPTIPHGLVSAAYSASGLSYPPSMTMPTPAPPPPPTSGNLMSAPPSSGAGGATFNGLNLSINPARLLGPAHLPHPLTSLINSLHGLNKHSLPLTPPDGRSVGSVGSVGSVSSANRGPKAIRCESPGAVRKVSDRCAADDTKEALRTLKTLNASAFRHVAPSSQPTSAAPPASTVAPSSVTTAVTVVSQNKTVWRPY